MKKRTPGLAHRAPNCPICGHRHQTRGEEKSCRVVVGQSVTANPKLQGSETTIYLADPLRGNKRAHAIARYLKDGMDHRKIAKRLNISKHDVEEIARKLAL